MAEITKRTRGVVIASVVFLVIAFLAGFIPQYRRAERLESELTAQRGKLTKLESNARLGTAALLASAMFLETSRMNYGNASRIASQFFSHVRSLLAETDDASTRAGLEQIVAKRDSVVAALARGDSGVQAELQQILDRLLALVRTKAG
jgi:hypothetical protein